MITNARLQTRSASSTLKFCLSRVGANLRTILRIFYWIFAILVIATGAAAWWYIYRPLPQIDGSVSLPGLEHEVTVERDLWGVPHIRAASVEDLAEAQGYVMAQDRLGQGLGVGGEWGGSVLLAMEYGHGEGRRGFWATRRRRRP